MKTKFILMMLLGAIALTILPACQTEPRYVTTQTTETSTLAPVAAGPGPSPAATTTETRTVRAY